MKASRPRAWPPVWAFRDSEMAAEALTLSMGVLIRRCPPCDRANACCARHREGSQNLEGGETRYSS